MTGIGIETKKNLKMGSVGRDKSRQITQREVGA